MKKNTKVTVLVYGIPMLLVGGLLYSVVRSVATRPENVESITSLGNTHIETVESPHEEYNSIPPTSGPHIGSIAKWGIHDEQIPDEIQIHNLEDGGVILHYGPKVSEEEIRKMSEIVDEHREGVILEPYVGMETNITLTAWGKILRLDAFDEEQIRAFIKSYQGIDHHGR